jgi:MYXO-CTERM domain-containing protein
MTEFGIRFILNLLLAAPALAILLPFLGCSGPDVVLTPVEDPGFERGDPVSISLSDTETRLFGHGDGAHAGFSVATVETEGAPWIAVGAPGNMQTDSMPGEARGVVHFSPCPVSGEQRLVDAEASLVGVEPGDHLGFSIAQVGDTDGDGQDDLLVGGQFQNAAYLFLSPVPASTHPDDSDAVLLGEDDPDSAGKSVAGAGDVDGDGLHDVLVGTFVASTGSRGAVYLVAGPISGSLDLSNADAIIADETPCSSASWMANGAGDTDGDSYDDIILGIGCGFVEATYDAAAYLFLGPVSGDLELGDADVLVLAESPDDRAGYGVAAAGDVDGDGHGDILIGAPSANTTGDWAGAVYLLHGPLPDTVSLQDADARIEGHTDNTGLGWSATTVGDLDLDGYDDVLLGAYKLRVDGAEVGGAALFFGPLEGAIPLDEADVLFQGEQDQDLTGLALSGGPDLTGDGYPDLLIGAPGADTTEHGDAGGVYVVSGQVFLAPGGCQCRTGKPAPASSPLTPVALLLSLWLLAIRRRRL